MPVENNQENVLKCSCPNCPSFNECMAGAGETLYCARDKSGCEVPSAGCICGNCPVWKENDLSSGYYCQNGKA